MFTIVKSRKKIPTTKFTLFANPHMVENHGTFTSLKTWSTINPDGSIEVAEQFFIEFRASPSMIQKYPEFYMITCECGNQHLEEYCQECCEHDYDPDEGFMCLNCNAEYPW